jgi:branched-subunit amino acid aminotransferase/4-amino-4-deoxychorismate lyase
MSEPIAFLSGRMIPQLEATLQLNDAGFVSGATVTDLVRTFRHQLYRWHEHLARFRQTCNATSIFPPHTDEEITAWARDLIRCNANLIEANLDLALVLFATPGPIDYYLGVEDPLPRPTFGMHTFPLPFARYRPWVEHGIDLITPSVRALANVDPHIKHRSRMHWWLADQEARRTQPEAMAILLDAEGNLTETASSNFLMVKNDVIVSPPRKSVLEGVSLNVVCELARRTGLTVQERPISLENAYTADEALLTCTTFCLAGVRSINQRSVPWPGPVYQKLIAAWNAEVGMDIHEQILRGA